MSNEKTCPSCGTVTDMPFHSCSPNDILPEARKAADDLQNELYAKMIESGSEPARVMTEKAISAACRAVSDRENADLRAKLTEAEAELVERGKGFYGRLAAKKTVEARELSAKLADAERDIALNWIPKCENILDQRDALRREVEAAENTIKRVCEKATQGYLANGGHSATLMEISDITRKTP